jgi:type VI secretion system protein VasD
MPACLRSAAIAIGLAGFAGCAAAPPPKPQPLTLTFESAAELNPSVEGTPSPVVVRVYQLAAESDFRNAAFSALYPGDATALLGKNLIAKQELVAFPGEKSAVTLELASGVHVLGILVAYRNIDAATWRLVCALKPATLRISLGANAAASRACT